MSDPVFLKRRQDNCKHDNSGSPNIAEAAPPCGDTCPLKREHNEKIHSTVVRCWLDQDETYTKEKRKKRIWMILIRWNVAAIAETSCNYQSSFPSNEVDASEHDLNYSPAIVFFTCWITRLLEEPSEKLQCGRENSLIAVLKENVGNLERMAKKPETGTLQTLSRGRQIWGIGGDIESTGWFRLDRPWQSSRNSSSPEVSDFSLSLLAMRRLWQMNFPLNHCRIKIWYFAHLKEFSPPTRLALRLQPPVVDLHAAKVGEENIVDEGRFYWFEVLPATLPHMEDFLRFFCI